MNTHNNKRRQASQEKMEKVFLQLLQERQINQITVSDICKRTQLNRSTFYANYADVYALADAIRDKLERQVAELYDQDIENNCCLDYLRLFRHIRDNPIFYITYFKLGYDQTHSPDFGKLVKNSYGFPEAQLPYHVEFHKAGLNAMIKMWLAGGCKESPEEMESIVKQEYRGRI